MTQDIDKKIRVELEHENKVIRLDALFYDLKGVLICEATEEEREKYHCGKYMTYPIVEDDWEVHEESCIAGGIGRKGQQPFHTWIPPKFPECLYA